ncbi:hypothetical protein ACE3MZ_23410 [Paenibacillus sp. WLX1005]|uniref:hypothetical protein n=1 Tax=Paenibacillus sp. WLX1005 TaxID=3243766 RepID=UPI003983E26A
MQLKDRMEIILEERYFGMPELCAAVVHHLQAQGIVVQPIDSYSLCLNDIRYELRENNVSMGGVPVQRVLLRKVTAESPC